MKPIYPEGMEWLPDWTDPTQYPSITGTSRTQWAWEFLRRNPEYQTAYSGRWNNPPADPGLLPPVPIRPNHPGRLVLEDESDLSRIIIQRFHSIYERFHLAEGFPPPDPRIGNIGGACFKANWFRYYRLDQDELIPKNGPSEARLLIEFDLSLPIEPQLKQARYILRTKGNSSIEEAQKRHGQGKGVARYKVQNLPDYLRILDAKNDLSQPTLPRIAQTVFPRLAGGEITKDHPLVEHAKEDYKVARKLRDLDYWKLVPLA